MADKKIPINFTSREYSSIRNELIAHAQRYYPETFRDFSEASFGSLMLDTVAYVGDQLSFYLDYQINESFLNTATEYDNVLKLSRQLGHKFSGRTASTGIAIFYILVPANALGLGPDSSYLPTLKKGAELISKAGVPFLLTHDINFANSGNEIIAGRVNTSTGVPTDYAIRAYGKVVAGRVTRENFNVGTFEKFRQIRLSNSNCIEVLRVFDSAGHEYYEVDYLSQNVIYKEVSNFNADREVVTSVMRPFVVPRRFVTERLRNNTYLQFGYGSESELTSPSMAEPSGLIMDKIGSDYITDVSFDPSKMFGTDKFGVAPANTTITVEYRVANPNQLNVPTGALTTVSRASFSFENPLDLSVALISQVQNSLEVDNGDPILGSVTMPSSEEVKRRVTDSFATQNRAVTTQDLEAIVYAMPPKFGGIKRCKILRDPDSFKRNLNLYVLSENVRGHLSAPTSTLKENLKLWLGTKKMIHDTIDILDARVVNIGIDFSIIADRSINNYDVLEEAVNELVKRYSNPLFIAEPFHISEVYSILNHKVRGVVDVKTVKITTKVGGNYSSASFNIAANKSADGRYVVVPQNVALEIKYPKIDIKGTVV